MGEIILHMLSWLPIPIILPLLFGWLMDRALGDPIWLSHPVIWFGKIISLGDKKLNKESDRMIKGGVMAIILIFLTFILTWVVGRVLLSIHDYFLIIFNTIIVFYCLAGTGLAEEVKQVFIATDKSLEAGREQVARIVGRDTSNLSAQQVRTAALETLSENLNDGVIAPLFWYTLVNAPGMLAYKMVNTLDSMIGYKSERYKDFGCWAARIDDIANYIPARLTAFLMVIVSGRLSAFSFISKYAHNHASPNSGYPESALAGILDCRFGGPNTYFGQIVDKPYIGDNNRELDNDDMEYAIKINKRTEFLMIILSLIVTTLIYNILFK